ncbi:uncharacterized protein LTR77_000396 [Saxophila tyrrhenica]|uniref:Uncharacterized protein n=1 Tax=Saxophila tyrrhenica TaxID=1690608 RepID=A0AAV9PMX2_9PEZI|nr:hypothetical protein LTR77_000396 [Saxophila tyrrhenica]
MKFRQSFQVFRNDSREEGGRPTTAAYNKIGVRETQSTAALSNGADEKQQTEAQAPPTKNAMQDFLQKTGAGLRATGANLKARSAKLERRIPRKRSKVVKPTSKRNSVQVRTFDLDDKVMDRLTRSPKEKKATEAFLEKQRTRASTRSRHPSNGVSPMSSKSQAELDRRPLSPLEIEAMFLGAPYFQVRKSVGHYNPEVAFQGGDVKTTSKFSPDYEGFSHASFAASTLSKSRSQEQVERPSSEQGNETVKYGSDVLEVPSMLSAEGLDTGAVGFEHFLQLPIADDLAVQDDTAPLKKREQLQMDPEWLGLRQLNMEHMIDRLTEMGELFAAIKEHQWESPDPWNRRKIEEMGEELFDKLLSAELGTTSAGTGSVTLKTQVAALQRVLNTNGLWRDFSRVEWRTRVGQLLWAPEDFEQTQVDGSRTLNERDVFLLQITLSAELLMRLLALEALSFSFPPIVSQEDAEALDTQRGPKIKWDLILADRFLSNLNISAKTLPPPIPTSAEKGVANRSSFFSAITFFSAKEDPLDQDSSHSVQPLLFAKNEPEQLAGLAHFAHTLQWPHADDVQRELESKLSKPFSNRPLSTAASIYATPLSSPRLPPTPGARNSFFAFPSSRPGFSRKNTAQSVSLLPARNIAGNVESFEVGGWLSRSWLSGLVMPGEPGRHFLMSALLENSPQAITVLGEEANLYGGFVYGQRGFWSQSCIVGRVLAAVKGSVGCMGWVSVPLDGETRKGLDDGWMGVDAQELPAVAARPCIRDSEAVAKESDPIKGHKVESLQAGDFNRPTDGPLVMGNEVKFEGLSIATATSPFKSTSDTSSSDSVTPTDEPSSTSTAVLTFSSPINKQMPLLTVPLTYDVQFISSYPCHPQTTRPRGLSRPLTPSPQFSFEHRSTPSSAATGTIATDGRSTPRKHQPKDSTTSSTPNKAHHQADLSGTPSTTAIAKPPTPWTQGTKHPSNPSTSSSSSTTLTTTPKENSFAPKEKNLPSLPAHPLHIDFQHTVLPAASLLSLAPESRPRALSSPTERKMSAAMAEENGLDEEVVVLDCRGNADLEVLARAWCAMVGESAVVGRSGRTCLACCVREARACGVVVVIRV